MSNVIEPIRNLAAQYARLPGIGAKSALRLAFHTVGMSETEVRALSDALIGAKARVHFCSVCGAYTDDDPCALCTNPKRSSEVLCVVKDARDVYSLEKTREFAGRYHVLGGVLSPMDGVGPDDLRIAQLLERIKAEGVKEVIIATSLDVEGEATAHYLHKLLKPLGVRVSRIAHGVPVGGNLEFTDELTLIKALEGRREME